MKNAPQKVKYLEINLTEDIQNLYAENYKTLLREIKDLQKCMNHICKLEDSVLLKWQFSPNRSIGPMQSQILTGFFFI